MIDGLIIQGLLGEEMVPEIVLEKMKCSPLFDSNSLSILA